MPEIGTSGSMSGDGKRSAGHRPQATAPRYPGPRRPWNRRDRNETAGVHRVRRRRPRFSNRRTRPATSEGSARWLLGLRDAGCCAATRIEALRAGLSSLGYIEGQNIAIEFRWAKTADELREVADQLVAHNVDIIFATSSTETGPARQATKTIPIVFATHADPVGTGHVASLARPGGNVTGLSVLLSELIAKATRDTQRSGA